MDQLVVIDGKCNVIAFELESTSQGRIVRSFSTSGYIHEASDMAIYKRNYYITDYKTHAVVVYSMEGLSLSPSFNQ